jgi:uncharacterized repeat protein (TIGR01451 family)
MKVSKVLALASLTGVVAASAIASPALAWHPKGVIKKSVQNQTTASALSDANSASDAVAAKPGDTLKYVIEVSNTGAAGDSNQMFYTKLTDALPAGVELIANPGNRTITEDLGVIKPGAKVTKEYLVKVTSTKDGDVIENKACFTGDSEVKDNPQQGCDVADVKVSIPKETPKPTPTPTPAPTPTPTPTTQTPAPTTPVVAGAELPATGASEILAPLAALTTGAGAYAGRLLVIKRRQK